MEKRTHGEASPLWEKYNLKEKPPISCEFRIGDNVIFENDYGIKFKMEVMGFAKDINFYGRYIHLITPGTDGIGNAYWFPVAPSSLTKINNRQA